MKKELVHQFWSNGKPMEYNGKKYRVAKMSYGTYFLEPWNDKYPQGRGERFNFASGTLELENDPENKYQYKVFVSCLS